MEEKRLPVGKKFALFGNSENGLDDFFDISYHTSSEFHDKAKVI